ncbi:MAG: hypothetical protein AB2L07_15550 [Thermoanaerobaculaceae bacterium]
MRKLVVAVLVLAVGTVARGAEKREEISRAFPAPAGKLVLIDAGPLDLLVRVAEIEEIRGQGGACRWCVQRGAGDGVGRGSPAHLGRPRGRGCGSSPPTRGA